MPNRPFHVATSTPAGAFYKANQQNGLARAVEALGGAFGGYCGGILPDCIDPPFHPGHRSLGHGFVPMAAAGAIWNQCLDGWQSQLRRLADERNYRRPLSTDPAATAWHALAEWALRMLAGFLVGLGAGYVTHVALDFGTPCYLPLVS